MDKSKDDVKREVEFTREEAKEALENVTEVWSGRNAIASLWRSTKGSCLKAQDRIAESAHATDQAVRSHIYVSLGIAFGVGMIVGALSSRKSSKKNRNC